MTPEKNKSLLFIAATNGHIINIVNVKSTYFKNISADLYIFESDRISTSLVESIIANNVFRRIIYIPLPQGIHTKHSKSKTLRRVMNAFTIAKGILDFKKNFISTLNSVQYSDVFINNLGFFNLVWILAHLLKQNPELKLHIVEEGSGEYYKDERKLYMLYPYIQFYEAFLSLILKIRINRFALIQKIESVYVYVPELFSTSNYVVKRSLPHLTFENTLPYDILVSELGSTDYSEYVDRRYYYFVSGDGIHNYYDSVDSIISVILSVAKTSHVLIKDHPRFLNDEDSAFSRFLSDIYVDQRNFLLESIYAIVNLDDKILITDKSAVVLHPKYMFNKEPFVVFTFNLERCDPNNIGSKMYDNLKAIYEDNTKIYAPKTLDELKKTIMDIEIRLQHKLELSDN